LHMEIMKREGRGAHDFEGSSLHFLLARTLT